MSESVQRRAGSGFRGNRPFIQRFAMHT